MRVLLVATLFFGFLIQGLYATSDDSQQVVKFLRSFFDEDTGAPLSLSEAIVENKSPKLSSLLELSQSKFHPKDIWGNRDYVFGYGLLADGSTILFAWKNNEDSPSIALKELCGIYEDERMASIQDEQDLKRWKKMREIVAGAFIGVRKSESSFISLYPSQDGSLKTGRASLTDLVVDRSPLVVRFSAIHSDTKTKNLLSSVTRVPTR